ncbi:MAG: serine hydrolase [Pyrinomonadaceae bacterium]|nr:serine hydrolase [Pyrinomonadaceae bacterium]
MMKALILFFALFLSQTVAAQIDKEIADVLRERVAVGKTNQSIVVAVVDANGTRFVSYGKTSETSAAKDSDENTVFEIGSITKVFTGTLLAESVRRGEVRFDDPISKYLPQNVKIPVRDGKEITLLDLATQTSGLPRMPSNFAPKNPQNPFADYTEAQMYDFLSGYNLTREIGSRYEYSNVGIGLLGHVLSLRAKMSYEDLVKTRILKPLKMNDTTITLSPVLKSRMAQGFDVNGEPKGNWDLPTFAGAGALRSTAKDMAKFLSANMNLSKSNLYEVFSQTHKPLRDASGKMKIGLVWQILPDSSGDITWHNGGTGGFSSFAGFDATQKKGIVVLTNTAKSVDDIGFHFLNAQNPLSKIKPTFAVNEKILDEYAGTYELAPNVIFTITRTGDKIYAQLTNQPNVRVFAESETSFYYKIVEAKLTFNRAANGKIESLTLHQNGDKTARKLK